MKSPFELLRRGEIMSKMIALAKNSQNSSRYKAKRENLEIKKLKKQTTSFNVQLNETVVPKPSDFF